MAIERMVVVGAGQMGAGIAQVAALAGIEVTLVDAQKGALETGLKRIHSLLAKAVDKGKLTADAHQAALAKLKTASAISDVKTAQFAVEAVTENESVKKAIFEELEVLRPEAMDGLAVLVGDDDGVFAGGLRRRDGRDFVF